jgi:hypothetical protein
VSNASIVFAGGEPGVVRAFKLGDRKPAWLVELSGKIREIAGGVDSPYVYILGENNNLYGFDKVDGRERFRFNTDQLATKPSVHRFRPYQMAWVPVRRQLLLLDSLHESGDNGLLLNAECQEQVGTMRAEHFLCGTAVDSSGRFVTTTTNMNTIQIWDLQEKREIYNLGEARESAIDAPFVSNAVYGADGTLIFTVDDSWATGTVEIGKPRTDEALAEFGSRNGHVEIDVDFAHERLALVGTERALTIVDFDGDVLSELQNATAQRSTVVRFSPDGSRVAVGSWDTSVRVFEIADTKPEK